MESKRFSPDDPVAVDFGADGEYYGIVIGVDGDRITVLVGLRKVTVPASKCRTWERPKG